MTSRLCIFCGKRANSQEDVWPIWLNKLVRETKGGTRADIYEISRDGTRTWSTANDEALRTRRVCVKCNNGWMSELEVEAGRVLTPLVKGHTVELSVAQQLTIALWSLKTAMVFDKIRTSAQSYFTQDERTYLLRTMTGAIALAIPPLTWVWLAVYRGREDMTSTPVTLEEGIAKTTKRREQSEVRGYTFTLSALCFVAQLLTARTPFEDASIDTGINTPLRFNGFIHEIWPAHRPHVAWPPQQVLNDTSVSLNDFAYCWAPSGTASLPLPPP